MATGDTTRTGTAAGAAPGVHFGAVLPPLANPSDLETLLRHENVDAADRELALRRASARFRGETEQTISENLVQTLRLDGNGTRNLLLPTKPIRGTVTVSIDGAAIGDYQISRQKGILRRTDGRFWPDGLENIEVTCTTGLAEIPGDIQDAVLEHAVTLALTYAHVQQETAGGTQAGYGKNAMVGVTQKWADTVARYKVGGRA